IVSVGTSSKSLNPYDAAAVAASDPVVGLYTDPVVRVFDARMLRPGEPLQFSMLAAPRLVGMMADETLALASAEGHFLLSREPFAGGTPNLEFFQVADEGGVGEALTCMALPQSGDGIALGTASGACIQLESTYSTNHITSPPPPPLPLLP
ncbi:unnamed protein product, partial [Discosporangium mesarthrocarpum]